MSKDFWRKKSRGSRIWYTRIQYPDGRRVVRSTGCTDISAARAARGRLEREVMAQADPAQNQAPYPLGQTLTDFISDRERAGRRPGTLQMYTTKSGHLMRLLGKETDINELTLACTEGYVDQRLTEGASRHTIHKELVTFNGSIKLAIKRGHCRLRLEEVKLDGFKAGYTPKERRLSQDEYQSLEAVFKPHRARHLRFFVLTGACLGEAERCERKDVDLDNEKLHLPGTKRVTRDRYLPFGLLPGLKELLKTILSEMPADSERLFAPWANIRRDLRTACDDLEIDPVSPNDLRRTFGSWLKNRGLDSAVIARLMGHSSTRMVDRVYGRLDDYTLAVALGKLGDIEMPAVPSSGEAPAQEVEQAKAVAVQGGHEDLQSTGDQRQHEPAGGSRSGSSDVRISADGADGAEELINTLIATLNEAIGRNPNKQGRKVTTPPDFAGGAAVPRDRVELPTRGFSEGYRGWRKAARLLEVLVFTQVMRESGEA